MSSEAKTPASFGLVADPWIASHLGKPSWRVVPAAPDAADLRELERDQPVFAYAKLAATDLATMRALVSRGFFPVDVAVTFEGPPPAIAGGEGIRYARKDDREAVTRIAGSAFRFSRFHLDPAIPQRVANAIKAEWAGNFFSGQRGDAMLVAEHHGAVVGFLQLLWQPDKTLVIDLIAVDPSCQGLGIARRLIGFAAKHGAGEGRVPAKIRVGTQVANVRSVRLYEAMGFRLAGAQYVLHLHRPSAEHA